MRNLLIGTLVLALSGPMALAQEGKREEGGKDPTPGTNPPPALTGAGKGAGGKRLADACVLASSGRQDEALSEFVALWDEQAGDDRIRLEVIEQIGKLSLSHPPARAALKARRDAELARLGPQPTFTRALRAVMAMNRALGESKKNEELVIMAAGGATGIRKFSARPADPMPPTMSRAGISQRATENRLFQTYQEKGPAVAFIVEEIAVATGEELSVKDEVAKALAELDALKASLAKVEPGSPEEWKILYNMKLVQSYIENELNPTLESLGKEIPYYKELKTHRESAKG